MKISKFNEVHNPAYSSPEEELESHIRDIISNELELRQVKYSDDYEISSDSVDVAAKKVMDYLKSRGLTVALESEKFNI